MSSDDQNVATSELVKTMFAKHIPRTQMSCDREDIMTWKDVSFAADKLFLLLFTAVNIILAAIFVGVLAGDNHD